MRPYILEGRQPEVADRGGDGALAHAVAAANLLGVRHGRNGALRVHAAERLRHRLTEDEGFAKLADIGLRLHQVEVPAAVDHIAEQNRAGHTPLLQDHALVDPAPGVAEHHVLATLSAGETSRGKDIDAGDLQPRLEDRTAIGAIVHSGQNIRQRAAHLPDGRDQAIGDAPMFGALADGEDGRVGSAHLVVHHHAAPYGQAATRRQGCVRPDTDGHDQQAAGNDPTVLELQAADLAVLAQDRLGLGAQHGLHAAISQGAAQQEARRLIELALHQHVHQVDDRGPHPSPGQPVGGLKTQQPAADHHGLAARIGGGHHGLHIVQVAEGDDAGQVRARQRQPYRIRAGSQDQPVIGRLRSVAGPHHPGFTVDLGDRAAGVQGDGVVAVPGLVIEDDVGEGLLSGEDGREHDAVVVHPGLSPEDGDLVAVGVALEHFLHRAAAGHAVADDDKTFLGHGDLLSI